MESTAQIRIITMRAPGLIPSLLHETQQAGHPVLLVPSAYTLDCELSLIHI